MAKESQTEKRERMSAEGKVAMAERATREAFVEKNTARLRELRLAKEEAERAALAAAPPVKPKPKKKKARPAG